MRQIEGRNSVLEALKAQTKITKLYIDKNVDDDDKIKKIISLAGKNNINLERKSDLRELSKTNGRHQGVIAIAEKKEKIKLKDFIENIYEKNETPLVVLLSGTVYEHNLGSVLRSAECFGAHLVIVSNKSFGLTPLVAKSSSGASEHIDLLQADLHNSLKILQKQGLLIVGLSEKTKKIISEIKFDVPLCIIIGSEDKGIKDTLEKYIDDYAKIPMTGKIESLNMATATSVALYETFRQRRN